MAKGDPILEVEHLVKHFPIKSGIFLDREVASVKAVDDVSFTLHEGETLGPRRRVRLRQVDPLPDHLPAAQADVGFGEVPGQGAVGLSRKKHAPGAPRDPDDLPGPIRLAQSAQAGRADHRRPAAAAGLASGTQLRREVQQLMDRVGLQPEHYNRYPHEFSGGQRQRIGIARALALRPKLIIADEPVSALDVSIQAQIINLLEDLQDEFNLSYIFVAHDLGVVRHVSDRIAVMYLGKIVERSPADVLYARPIHPYSVALLSAVPIPDPKANAAREPIVLEGDVPSPVDPPSGCRFHTRCPWATEICSEEEPPLAEYGTGQAAACHHPRNVDEQQIAGTEVAPDSPESASERLPGAEQAAAVTR